MSRALSTTIRNAFLAIERLTDSSSEASRLFREAFEASLEQERRHRATGRSFAGATYKMSAPLAAEYFAARSVLTGGPAPKSWLDAAQIRTDIALGYAVRDWLVATKPDSLRAIEDMFKADLLAIDYAKDFAA